MLLLTSLAAAQSAKPAWLYTDEERIALRTRPNALRFDGATHPEFFLPHEVFRSLIQLAFRGAGDSSERFRKGMQPEVDRLGLPADFWERLRVTSIDYVAAAGSEDECRSRADALAASRGEFGEERFDRFLYEVIAVHKFHSADELPDPEVLRRVVRGCR
jgi:hypothetical protein